MKCGGRNGCRDRWNPLPVMPVKTGKFTGWESGRWGNDEFRIPDFRMRYGGRNGCRDRWNPLPVPPVKKRKFNRERGPGCDVAVETFSADGSADGVREEFELQVGHMSPPSLADSGQGLQLPRRSHKILSGVLAGASPEEQAASRAPDAFPVKGPAARARTGGPERKLSRIIQLAKPVPRQGIARGGPRGRAIRQGHADLVSASSRKLPSQGACPLLLSEQEQFLFRYTTGCHIVRSWLVRGRIGGRKRGLFITRTSLYS